MHPIYFTSFPCGTLYSQLVTKVISSSTREKTSLVQNLIEAVKLALGDLKKKHPGALLTAHAPKIRDYAPGLATTISDLIQSSTDTNFKEECYSRLGIQSKATDNKILSVIEMDDRNPKRKNKAATYPFEDDCIGEPAFDNDHEYEEGGYSSAKGVGAVIRRVLRRFLYVK